MATGHMRPRDCHFGSVFFRYWIGHDFALIAAPVRANPFHWRMGSMAWAFVSFTLIQGQGRPRCDGKIALREILPFLGILWLLTSTLGLNGGRDRVELAEARSTPFRDVLGAGMSRRVIIAAIARPAALLFASEAVAQFGGHEPHPGCLRLAALVGVVAAWMAYLLLRGLAAARCIATSSSGARCLGSFCPAHTRRNGALRLDLTGGPRQRRTGVVFL